MKLFRQAAEQGLAYVQYALDNSYVQGKGGLAQNDEEAARLYRQAAEQGFADGQFCLGNCFKNWRRRGAGRRGGGEALNAGGQAGPCNRTGRSW
mmetsp:Transcript_35061/g.87432  ORF Transcript_35061/g.87432 Transcript_35061/m.87432 type:complete len:94 (+) Transcript_35061:229-510(+)